MKINDVINRTLLLAALLIATGMLSAQSEVPSRISYQGVVTDLNGGLVGDPTPVNRTVTFRVWNRPTAVAKNNLFYSEQQVVTIAKGEFSVLVGGGVAVNGEPLGFSESAVDPDTVDLADIFNGENRYLGVTVDDGQVGNDPEISPRQQIVSTAFAFRAKVAETVASSSINALALASDSVTSDKIADDTITGSHIKSNTITGSNIKSETITGSNIQDKTITSGRMSDNSIISRTIKNGSVKTEKIYSSAVTSDKIAADAVTSDKIADGTITGSHISSETITSGDMSDNSIISRTIKDGSIKVDHLDATNLGAWRVKEGNIYKGTGTTDLSGNVGIGTDEPTKGRLHVHGYIVREPTTANDTVSIFTHFGEEEDQPDTYLATSIYASAGVTAAHFTAFSDARIKRVEGRSDSSLDLSTLMGIEITDYSYIDTYGKGESSHKKVIAQQVEKVYPQVVSKSTDEIPDIYEEATFLEGWVELATDLKVGERVRLIGTKEEGIHEVLEVRDGAFRTAFVPATEQIFVYGREVNDFRQVDYEGIAMLNVSATQQIKKEMDQELKALKEANAELKARLAAIEKLLRSK